MTDVFMLRKSMLPPNLSAPRAAARPVSALMFVLNFAQKWLEIKPSPVAILRTYIMK